VESSVRFLVLGPVAVEHDGVTVSLGPKLRTLLGVLIAAEGRSLSPDRLGERLWSVDSGTTATVRSHVYHLRQRLEQFGPGVRDLLVHDSVGWALRLDPEQLDAAQFGKLHAAGSRALGRGDPEAAARLLRSALALWRGPAYDGLEDRGFAVEPARKLNSARKAATVARIQADLDLGRQDDVVDDLAGLAASDPTDERIRHLWALAAYRAQGAESASAVCRDALRTLRGYGIDAPALTGLHEKILRRAPELDWQASPGPIFEVRPRDLNFVGRDNLLREMRSRLISPDNDLAAAALHGLGGVGKTHLAVEFAYRHADSYQVVYEVPAQDPIAAAVRLCDLARRLAIPASGTAEETLARLWERLRVFPGRWLLIYDDADTAHDLLAAWPRAGHGHVIVTSRNPSWAHRATPIEVTPPDRADAIEFISRRLHGNVDHAEADAIADRLGNLPLALAQACAYIEQTAISAESYLRLAQADDAPLRLEPADASEQEKTIATTWNLSLQKVRQTNPAAAQLLQLCAFFSSAVVPRQLMPEHARLLPEPLRSAASDTFLYNDAIQVIKRYSLATITDKLISVHTVLQAVIRGLLAETDVAQWAGAAVRLLDAAFPRQAADESSLLLLGHAATAAGHARRADVEAQATVSLLMKAADAATSFGDPRSTVGLLSEALLTLERRPDPRWPIPGVLIRLGYGNREYGELEAARHCFEQAAERARQESGPRSDTAAEALTGLGMVLFDLSELSQAHEWLTTSLDIRRSDPAADPLKVATTYSVLGLVLWSMRDLDAAAIAHQTSLRIREHELGPEDPAVATSLDNLAKVIFDRGDLATAREMNERALRIREQRLGRDHYHVGISLNHLGYALRELSDLDGALNIHRRALDIFRNQLGPDHSHVARSLHGIGSVLLRKEDLKAARDAFADAAEIFSNALGAEHPGTASCRADFGYTLYRLGEEADGRQLLEDALAVLAAKLPPVDPDLIRARAQFSDIESSGEPAG
jgi:DNA-binding SARP family transcriptional activator/tetratricopeptide (TPR) repeat protein